METGTPEAGRAVIRLMVWFVALSALSAFGSVFINRTLEGRDSLAPALRGAIALAPVAPFILMLWVFARTYRHLDEMVIRVQSESLACTLGATLVATVGWGQLQRVGLLPLVDLWAVWPLAAVLYLPCLLLARRRYR